MKPTSFGHKSLAIAAGFGLVGMNIVSPVFAASPNSSQYKIAQISENCRQVAARNGLYVRRSPTVYSTALGVIPRGRYVTIVDGGTKRWVRIAAPLPGYVFAGYLTSCQAAPPLPGNCRQVAATNGVYVRQAPSVNSAVVGVIANRRYVTIANQGVDGWVPISVPLRGYVAADFLGTCS